MQLLIAIAALQPFIAFSLFVLSWLLLSITLLKAFSGNTNGEIPKSFKIGVVRLHLLLTVSSLAWNMSKEVQAPTQDFDPF